MASIISWLEAEVFRTGPDVDELQNYKNLAQLRKNLEYLMIPLRIVIMASKICSMYYLKINYNAH